MNFDPTWIQYEAEQDRREQEQDEMAVHWDSCKAEISSIVDQFGWANVNDYLRFIRPNSLVFALLAREGQEITVSFDNLPDSSMSALLRAKSEQYPGWKLVESW